MSTETSALSEKRSRVLRGMTALLACAGLAYGVHAMTARPLSVETDNAYVGGQLVALSSQVAGTVLAVGAEDTEMVHAGAELIRLDPADADIALALAAARLGNEVRQLRERYASIGQFDAMVVQHKMALKAARDDLARRVPLVADHAVSGEELAHATEAAERAAAALEVAVRQAAAARAGLDGVGLAEHPLVQAARAEYLHAWLARRRTAIVAPVSGYVAKRNVQPGARIAQGVPLLTIVPLDRLWVDANFKESQLSDIRAGQRATIHVDMYGSKVAFHGKVLGLAAGTGSAFSLLPAQNASGNWIKVVQRLPVRIALAPQELAAHPLRVGLSATVSIDTTGAAPAAPALAARAASAVQGPPVLQAQRAIDAIIASNLRRGR